jgi:hypothetical protein
LSFSHKFTHLIISHYTESSWGDYVRARGRDLRC